MSPILATFKSMHDAPDRRGFVFFCLGAYNVLLSRQITGHFSCLENGIASAMNSDTKTPRIARIWRGRVPREKAAEYQKYNYEAGVRPLMAIALGVQALREDRETETEFVTISYWESVEAMSRFTGGDPTKIHHLPRDEEFLIEIPKSVQILQIYENHGQIT